MSIILDFVEKEKLRTFAKPFSMKRSEEKKGTEK
jgi:hypothetical protein